ncbi:MAG TPA: hypothetical protein VN650_09590, partial [Gemmatimonadaceae bacterium]|nr:hypothetical protein [Gemmatimonadaceae bacterium]
MSNDFGAESRRDGASEADVVPTLPAGISRQFLLHHGVCPEFTTGDGAIRVLVAPDAVLPDAIDDLEIAYDRPAVAVPAARAEVERLIA